MPNSPPTNIVVIGGGFAGLAAAYELGLCDSNVTLFEDEPTLGGLAGSFSIGGQLLEKSYHHWFSSEDDLMNLIEEMGVSDNIIPRPSNTGMYYNKRIHRLTSPLDLLLFTPLPLLDRLRFLWVAIWSRQIKDGLSIEHLTAAEWITQLGGRRMFEVVWEPLLRGKFGPYADTVSATYLWATLNIHGGVKRRRNGTEKLFYYKGGFAALAQQIAARISSAGGVIHSSEPVQKIEVSDGKIVGVHTTKRFLECDAVISTVALPITAELLQQEASEDYLASLRKIEYLANICLVLILDRSLSSTYWLNVSDPSFPFVAVIEHTNFEPTSSYEGKHVVYLSKYVVPDNPMYRMTTEEYTEFCVEHLQRMFPQFERSWIRESHVWRSRWAQPIAVRGYSAIVPDNRAPIRGLFLASMAQIYPEDRGVSRAIREGRRIARMALEQCHDSSKGTRPTHAMPLPPLTSVNS